MASIADSAREHGLPVCAALLDGSSLEPSIDVALRDRLPTQPVEAIDAFRRRGLDPRLVRIAFDWFGDRPLELGLFSWDVLCSSLISDGDPGLLQQLRKNASRVREILPAPGSVFVSVRKIKSAEAIARWAMPAYESTSEDDLIAAAITQRSLGAAEQLRRRHGIQPLDQAGFLESTRQLGLTLHLGHLSTLASLYLDYAFRGLGNRSALGDYVEVLLDVGAINSLPDRLEVVPTQSVPEFELFGYMHARSAIIRQEQREIFEALKQGTTIDYASADFEALLQRPRSHLPYAEAGLELDEFPVPYPLIDEIASRHPGWRYAHRVRASLVAATADIDSPHSPLFADKFLEMFGNEFRLWYCMRRYAKDGASWVDALTARLLGEVAALPHDAMAWSALASAIKTKERDAFDEVRKRIAWQCELGPTN
jgi:hypothetical protein